jgi:uncharacterized protein YqgC (DUF456 family)
VFFMLIPLLTALAVVVIILPALVPGVAVLGLGYLAYHSLVRHRQQEGRVRTR